MLGYQNVSPSWLLPNNWLLSALSALKVKNSCCLCVLLTKVGQIKINSQQWRPQLRLLLLPHTVPYAIIFLWGLFIVSEENNTNASCSKCSWRVEREGKSTSFNTINPWELRHAYTPRYDFLFFFKNLKLLVRSSVLALRSGLFLVCVKGRKNTSSITTIGCHEMQPCRCSFVSHQERKKKKNLFLTLTSVTKCQDLKRNLRRMSHSQHGTVHPHTVCVYTVLQRATEEAWGRFLPFPLGHLLTLSLDLSEFGLRGDLCDAFHSNAFEKYGSLGGRRRKTESWIENKDTPSHASRRNI